MQTCAIGRSGDTIAMVTEQQHTLVVVDTHVCVQYNYSLWHWELAVARIYGNSAAVAGEDRTDPGRLQCHQWSQLENPVIHHCSQ